MDAWTEPFFLRVVAAGLLASVACGVIGTFVVARRIAGISGGISHAAFGGVGLGYLLDFDPTLGAAAFGLAAGVAIGLVSRRVGAGLDTLISMVWAVGMALGVLFVALAPGYAPDLTGYLFGSLLLVPWKYVLWIALVDAIVLGGVAVLFKELQATSFDEEFAEVAGLPVEALFLGLLALTSLAVVVLIRVAGVILAIALLTIPAAASRQWTRSLRPMMAWATAACAACTLGGLLLSWSVATRVDVALPPGPLVILLAAALYVASSGARALVRRRAEASGSA
ncbi:MAG TPA: metal ABC transporter permease [Myxococcota bacterium]|nr:metal ABC transporter permease [Myxococcota bacterium]